MQEGGSLHGSSGRRDDDDDDDAAAVADVEEKKEEWEEEERKGGEQREGGGLPAAGKSIDELLPRRARKHRVLLVAVPQSWSTGRRCR